MAGLSAVAAIMGYLAAHAGMLEPYGITTGPWPFTWPAGQEPTGPCILIEMDTLSAKGIAALTAVITVAIGAIQHHTTPTQSPSNQPKGETK